MNSSSNVNLWEESAAGRCDVAGEHYYMLRKAIDTQRLDRVPKLIVEIIDKSAWKKWRWIGNDFETSSLEEYITKHPPSGIGASIELVARLLADHPDAFKKFKQALKGEAAERAAAADLANLRPAGRPKIFDSDKDDIQDKAPTGTSAAAALRRLRKDRPDIYERVLAGELTAHAGMVEAGFREKRRSKKLTLLQKILKMVEDLSESDREELIEHLIGKEKKIAVSKDQLAMFN